MLLVQFYLKTVILTMQYSEGTRVCCLSLSCTIMCPFLFVQHSLLVNLIAFVLS